MTTLHIETALLPEGWARDVRIVLDGGVIQSVTPDAPLDRRDERHAIAIPGVSSVHSHAFQRGMAALAEIRGSSTDTFWTWREAMYNFVLALSPEQMEAVARLLYVEMLEAGFTRVGEFHYLHHDCDGAPYANLGEMAERIAAAASATGIGLTLLPCFYAHATFGGAPPHPGQRRFINSTDQFAKLVAASRAAIRHLPGANLGVAPHSLRAVTPDELKAVAAMASGAPIHIHAAEQVKEVEDCVAWGGRRPVEWLLANMPVDKRWCLIHATHMTDAETSGLARSGATAGLCPVTEASLGDGIFPAREFRARGGVFAVGTDSNILVGVTDELRQLEYGQRLKFRERNVLAEGADVSTGRTLFDGALMGGAVALAQGTCGLAAGRSADIVTLDAAHPSLVGRSGDVVLDGWIFAGGRDAVDCVWVGGIKVVQGGRHHLRDQARRAYKAALVDLMP